MLSVAGDLKKKMFILIVKCVSVPPTFFLMLSWMCVPLLSINPYVAKNLIVHLSSRCLWCISGSIYRKYVTSDVSVLIVIDRTKRPFKFLTNVETW